MAYSYGICRCTRCGERGRRLDIRTRNAHARKDFCTSTSRIVLCTLCTPSHTLPHSTYYKSHRPEVLQNQRHLTNEAVSSQQDEISSNALDQRGDSIPKSSEELLSLSLPSDELMSDTSLTNEVLDSLFDPEITSSRGIDREEDPSHTLTLRGDSDDELEDPTSSESDADSEGSSDFDGMIPSHLSSWQL